MKLSTLYTAGIFVLFVLAFTNCNNAEVTKELESLRLEVQTLKADLDTCRTKHEEALEDMEDAFKRLEEKDAELKTMLENQSKKK